MGRRLEKNYVFCCTTFLSLFTMKFVRYVYRKFPIYIGNLRYIYKTKYSLSWRKKSAKYIVNFRYRSEISDLLHTTKYALSWNRKRLENKSEISNLFCWLFCFNLQCICREVLQTNDFFPNGLAVWKNTVYFVILHDKYAVSWNKKAYSKFPTYFANFFVPTYSVFVVKCNKINNIFPNGVCATPTYYIQKNFCSNLECILSYVISWKFRYISEIYDIFCRLFLLKLRVYFVIYIYQTNFIVNKLKKLV